MNCDVAIVGGGPAGSTVGSFLKIYMPDLKVAIFERETFPRDHVGESQLPIISYYLDEMGVWDKVEAANFPIKIGATYKWGATKELWDFDFLPVGRLVNEPRPSSFQGQRKYTAFQVDRAIYDKILLDHAAELGCAVYQNSKVLKINSANDAVTGLELANGETVEAKYYIDASGHSGILRRALNVGVHSPTSLQNVAIWDYWQNAQWAEEIGVGGTRIQVISVDYGWIWFIPLGPTRTSVGLVIPAEYYKKSGRKVDELYSAALQADSRILNLLNNATSENRLQTTRDWSFLADRFYGENWFLVGECGGFADPILSAGLSITHGAGREAAFTIMEILRGKGDAKWLKKEYEKLQINRVTTHMRFADYWYSANAQFKDLQDYTKEIAKASGLDISPDKAWAWISLGGFIDDDLTAGTAGFSLSAIKSLGTFLSPMEIEDALSTNNVFTLNLNGATFQQRARYEKGRVRKYDAYVRDGKLLPLEGVFEVLVTILQRDPTAPGIFRQIDELRKANLGNDQFKVWVLNRISISLEAMITDGWVTPSHDPRFPLTSRNGSTGTVHWHSEGGEEA